MCCTAAATLISNGSFGYTKKLPEHHQNLLLWCLPLKQKAGSTWALPLTLSSGEAGCSSIGWTTQSGNAAAQASLTGPSPAWSKANPLKSVEFREERLPRQRPRPQDAVHIGKAEENKVLSDLAVPQIQRLAARRVSHRSGSCYALIWDTRHRKAGAPAFSLVSLKILHTSAPFTWESQRFYEF